ncbi:MAG: sugar transferase [bacterium]
MFNKLIALILLILLMPALLIIAFIIIVETKSFPVYIQKRGISFTAFPFRIYKFKTIIDSKKQLSYKNTNIFYKENLIECVSKFGAFLRKTGLDELPQLINIIKGDMNFIGPRPLSFTDLELLLTNNPAVYQTRNNINNKPGITGYWQVFGNRNEGINNLLAHELYYKNNISIKLNVKIIAYTIRVIMLGRHSDAIVAKEIYKFSNLMAKTFG